MQTISKTGLKIIDVELLDFEMNPEFNIDDLTNHDCVWTISLDSYRVDGLKNEEDYDELKIETKITYATPLRKEIFHIHVDTIFHTKHLKLKDVNEAFWFYITETAFRHCSAIARYKTKDFLPKNDNFPTLSMNGKADTNQKIYDLWG